MSRCIVLAEELRKRGHTINFIVNKDNLILKELRKRKFQFILVPSNVDPKKESSFIIETTKSNQFNAVIIDMREFSEIITKKLVNKDFVSILLDDAWCRKAYADIIFNGTIVKKYHEYDILNKKTKLFIGPKYFIMGTKFLEHRKKNFSISKKRKPRVIVSLGGSDPHNLTSFMIKLLVNQKDIQTTIIMGPLFKNKNNILKLIRHEKHFTIIDSPSKIWKKLPTADVAISNAGNTLYELAALNVPTLCISIVQHQIPYADEFDKQGFAINLGIWKKITSKKICDTLIHLLNSYDKRKKMGLMGSKIIDGKGLLRVTNILEKEVLKKL